MSSYSTVVTRKGQVTIPAEIRRSLGLKQGDRVRFVHDNGKVTVEPIGSVVERTAGSLAKYRREPALAIAEEKAAFERAVAEEVMQSLEREAAMYRGES